MRESPTSDIEGSAPVRMPKRLSVSISASPVAASKKVCYSPVKLSPKPGSISEVTPLLYISDDRVSSEDLVRLGITAIIDCRSDGERELRGPVGETLKLDRLQLSIRDNKAEDASRFFPLALHFIEEQRAASKKVLVHCTRGISRSSAVVCAYLIWSQDVSYRDAMGILRAKHPCADPNPSFAMQLVEFAMSRAKDTLAYEVSNDGKTLVGPLSKENVDALMSSQGSALLVISKLARCQYIWCADGYSTSTVEPVTRTAEMLAGMNLAPQRVEYVRLMEHSSVKEQFMETLTCL